MLGLIAVPVMDALINWASAAWSMVVTTVTRKHEEDGQREALSVRRKRKHEEDGQPVYQGVHDWDRNKA